MQPQDNDYSKREIPGTHPLSCFLSILCPCAWLGSCFTLQENVHGVVLEWGKFAGHYTTPGIHCSNPCGRTVLTISTRQIAHDLQNIKVVDARGNPLLISGVVRYYWANSVQTLLECEAPSQYVELLATAVMKQIISRFGFVLVFFFFWPR